LYQQLTPPQGTPPVVYIPGYVYGPYGPYDPSMYFGSSYGNLGSAPPATPPRYAQGYLRLESSPGRAQVFVDGAYVGLIDDFGISGRALVLDEGVHRVELRAPGYGTAGFDVNVAANQTIRYRGELQPVSGGPRAAAFTPAPPAPLKPTYMIPNCYAGDKPPSRTLPKGCELSKMVVRKP